MADPLPSHMEAELQSIGVAIPKASEKPCNDRKQAFAFAGWKPSFPGEEPPW